MTKTRDNHFVAQWYQKGFMVEKKNKLCHLKRRDIEFKNGKTKIFYSRKWYTSAQRFYEKDLYSTFFGTEVNDEIEQKLFGPIDDNGSKAIRAFLSNDKSQWHNNFQDLFLYLDAQKLRTPKGLDWIKTKFSDLNQVELMTEMQALRTIHCTLWAEGVRELVSAENSDVKFIISDHPVTIYNYACPPDSELCKYPNDPDISLKGSQTIFPLDKDRCLIITNLEYARDPDNVNPIEQRTNATRIRNSIVNTFEFINTRKLNIDEVAQINYIIEKRSQSSVAAGKEEWLTPENKINYDWAYLRQVLLPPIKEIKSYTEMFAKFENGSTYFQDAFGRTTPKNDYLNKNIDENKVSRNDFCGCGSGIKYKSCCLGVPVDLRSTWKVASIRERNLAFCSCIRDVLGLDKGKNWLDVRRDLSDAQVSKIYWFYSVLWPKDTDIYSLLPKSDGKFRALYTGSLDVRTIGINALPMASVFDALLIENPITNPNNVKPEFSPIESPSKYKAQALKDFLFMLEIEPYIDLGLVNLIPSPSEFDSHLMKGMIDMAKERLVKNIVSEQDRELHSKLAMEDLLNSIGMYPKDFKIKTLMRDFGISEEIATNLVVELESKIEELPLMLLQPLNSNKDGQLMFFRMGPNYEMALFVAQITGSVLITDSDSRWKEIIAAQHRDLGVVSYPWNSVTKPFNTIPIDHQFVDTYKKSQQHFSTLRNLLKSLDNMILDNDHNTEKLAKLSVRTFDFMNDIDNAINIIKRELKIISPNGGFYDSNVQRLLARSSCTRYDEKVRCVYGIGISD